MDFFTGIYFEGLSFDRIERPSFYLYFINFGN